MSEAKDLLYQGFIDVTENHQILSDKLEVLNKDLKTVESYEKRGNKMSDWYKRQILLNSNLDKDAEWYLRYRKEAYVEDLDKKRLELLKTFNPITFWN